MEDLEVRIKRYEECCTHRLLSYQPYIIRIDGRAFHTFTRGMEKPFDSHFIDMMNNIAINLCNEIPYAKIAYLQSDEINIFAHNTTTQSDWFDNKIAKITSITASLATAYAMNYKYNTKLKPDYIITFDSRAFTIPEHEIVNYFIFRQSDWERNSLIMLARKYYRQKQLEGKKKADLHDMIFNAGDNWNNLPVFLKRGRCVVKKPLFIDTPNGKMMRNKWRLDLEIPIFSEERDYILNEINIPLLYK